MSTDVRLSADEVGSLLGGRVAGAPINWGVCEVPGWGHVLPVEQVLGEMAELGLRSTELGPPGFLPDDPAQVRSALDAHGLSLVGGFLAVVLHDESVLDATLAEAERAIVQMSGAGGGVLVLAAATGLDGYDERPVLTEAQWATLVRTAGAVRDLAGRHGMRTTLHPHVGTHIEKPSEVEAFARNSDVPFCLDTGHLLIGGADPLDLAERYTQQIAHVHLKDVNLSIARRVQAGEITYMQGVQAEMYVPLGDGDVPVGRIVTTLESAGYQGWYVLEQDTSLPDGSPENAVRGIRDTARSLVHLASL